MGKTLRLIQPIGAYDFSKEPLASADKVIAEDGRVCKDRYGTSGRQATANEMALAEAVDTNR